MLKFVFGNKPRVLTIMTLKIGHVLKDQEVRLMVIQDSQDFIKQSAVSSMLKTVLRPGLGEGLTGESCAQHVVGGNVGYRHFADVAGRRHSEILVIERSQAFINLRSENTLVA